MRFPPHGAPRAGVQEGMALEASPTGRQAKELEAPADVPALLSQGCRISAPGDTAGCCAPPQTIHLILPAGSSAATESTASEVTGISTLKW